MRCVRDVRTRTKPTCGRLLVVGIYRENQLRRGSQPFGFSSLTTTIFYGILAFVSLWRP